MLHNKVKKLMAALCALALVLALGACGSQPSTTTAVFAAVVLETNDSSVTVQPDAASAEYKSADQIVVSLSGTALTDQEGAALVLSDLTAGDTVEITYDGYILESYPAQIKNCTVLKRTGCAALNPNPSDSDAAFHIQAGDVPDPSTYASVYSQPDFTEAAGFAVSTLPELGENMTYDMDYLIGGETAELAFTVQKELKMFLRIAVNVGQEDISGVEGSFEKDETSEFNGVETRVRATADGPAVLNWEQDGYIFSIYLPVAGGNTAAEIAQQFVGHITMVPENTNPVS